MQQNLPKTYSILAVILILACLVASYLMYSTYWPAYKQAQDYYAQTKTVNTQLTEALASVQTFLISYQQQETNTAKVNLALPAGQMDMPNFISSLSQLAQTSGVGLSNFQINASGGSDTGFDPVLYSIQTEDLSLTASGTYTSFKDFLQRVENHLRLIDIYHITIAKTTTQGQTSLLQFQIQIHTYFQQ